MAHLLHLFPQNKMNKRIVLISIAGVAAGIAIWLANRLKTRNQKRARFKSIEKLRRSKPGNTYSYEYTL
jgi:hypothetical protein